VRAELPDAPSPSSVRKRLDIMIGRHLLARESDGPRFVYFPAAAPEDASRSALQQLVRTFFGNSPGSAAAAAVEDFHDLRLAARQTGRLVAHVASLSINANIFALREYIRHRRELSTCPPGLVPARPFDALQSPMKR